MELDRRGFCTMVVGMAVPASSDGFEDRDLIVHMLMPSLNGAHWIGDVVYDPSCGRFFRLMKVIEASGGPLAKLRWVSHTAM